MGFDTYLQIDGEVLLMWRKHASTLPRVCFRFEDLRVEGGADEEGERVEVRFRTSADDALANLERAGLGWGAAVAAYADTRISGYSAGLALGQLAMEGHFEKEDANRAHEEFDRLPAETDLRSLGELMLNEWIDQDCDEVSLLGALTYDGDLPLPFEAAFGVWKAAEKRGVSEPFAAARAGESLALLDRTAPMLLWPLLVCVFLKHLPGTATIELVLDEDAEVSGDFVDEPSAREYASDYWSASSEELARQARTLQRLFAVLAGSTIAGGSEFWFARAADLLDRVELLRSMQEASTTARGDALEELVDALVHTEQPGLQVIEKNLRTTEEEIDLVLKNGLQDPFWSALSSPVILVECKNWSRPAGVEALRVLESKLRDRKALSHIGIFVSMAGFTKPFLTRLKTIQADVGIIFAITGDDLSTMVGSKTRITDWLSDEGLRRSLGGSSAE